MLHSVSVASETTGAFEQRQLTNLELRAAMDPSSSRMPYVFSHFENDHCAELGYKFPSAAA